MNKKSFNITIKKLDEKFDKSNIITIPLELFNKCSEMLEGKVKMGFKIINAIILPNINKDIVEMDPSILNELNISQDMRCNIKIDNHTVSLGPVIAVFTSNGSIRKAFNNYPKFRADELSKANLKAHTILYFFSINDVDFIGKTINGTYYDPQLQSWSKKTFPFPDILYDRGGGTLRKQKIISKYIREQLSNTNDLIYFNPTYSFDKFEVHDKLSNIDSVASYLPVSKLYSNSQDIEKMFKINSILYMKDCHGSNGRGVVRIQKFYNKKYILSYFKNNVIKEKLNNFNTVIKRINEIFSGKQKVIIQSAINLITLNTNVVDMRATVQRDGNGNINIAAFPVRVASPGSPVTSTKSGSCVYNFNDFFIIHMNYSEEKIIKLQYEIITFLNNIYLSIEKCYGQYGEIGIDFALDKKGKLWFIECNAKPGKDTLYLSCDETTIEKAFLNPLEYSKYITGFNRAWE